MSFASSIQRQVVLFARDHKDLQQFGQPADNEVWNGSTACTHLGLQFIQLFVHRSRLTLNQVNRLAGMPKNAKNAKGKPRGMTTANIKTFVKNTGLPYELVSAPPFGLIVERSKWGPVLYGMRYGSAPTRRGTVYAGVHAKPPYAIKNGRTQLKGAEDMFHAVIYIGDGTNGTYRKDPNHGSGARPERPAYDVITRDQAKREYNDVRTRLGHGSWALVPTRKVR